ncbi:autotransporter outer membrane beta-barrel domain-containing protein [Methylomicrobium lacus]|uniref:autotransporter outer membrane beta-barrel domain-containing protein n=1 Tax=Methylomicrobium lacus TaxID=136992 RepID=UPI0004BC6C38|nr:autotransporter outer membrane beta-barrel domain-containing protein [Methylomicrobium lacus]
MFLDHSVVVNKNGTSSLRPDYKLAVILLSLGLMGKAEAGNTLPPDILEGLGGNSEVIDSLTPGQIAGQVNSSFSQSGGQNSIVSRRLLEIRKQIKEGESSDGVKVSSNGLLRGQALGGAAGDTVSAGGLLDDRLGVYVTGHFSKGDRISTEWEKGFDTDNAGVLLGADYRLTDRIVLGSAFGYTDDKSQFFHNQGHLINRGYSGSIYGSYNITDNLYFDGVFTYTHNDYESVRELIFPDEQGRLITGSASSSPQGDQHRFSFGAGYDLPMGSWTVGLRARTEYGRTNINAYSEEGQTPYNLLVDKQFNDSVLTDLGWQISYAYSTPFGVLQPQLNLDWEHEFKNNSRDIVVHYNDFNNLPSTLRTNNPDRDYLVFRAGMSAILTHGISSFVQYETLLDHRYDTLHTASLGVRWEF